MKHLSKLALFELFNFIIYGKVIFSTLEEQGTVNEDGTETSPSKYFQSLIIQYQSLALFTEH